MFACRIDARAFYTLKAVSTSGTMGDSLPVADVRFRSAGRRDAALIRYSLACMFGQQPPCERRCAVLRTGESFRQRLPVDHERRRRWPRRRATAASLVSAYPAHPLYLWTCAFHYLSVICKWLSIVYKHPT